ncbi:MAG: hypothetical protein KatS3mg111_1702 [Pirellulaceae bacterium]|nr:MAG: hypothetical protein KatS3mg111_1702 [Pirellulaceae bacterium]
MPRQSLACPRSPKPAYNPPSHRSQFLDLTEPGPETHKLLTIQRFQVWEDGTVDDINVRTVQSNQWCEAVEASEGAEVPLPLDLVDMGLPEGLTGTVLSIQQCPQPPPGPGRLVLTTVNHLNRDVIELDLRGPDGRLETLRPTGNHKFYSVTRNAWLSAAELVEGEQLDGVGGLVTVVARRTLPGTHRVYNLTVQGEHLYRVATSGVLVHNNGCDDVIEMHHLLPRSKKVRGYFERAGLDIEDFKIPLDQAKHRLKPNGIHTNGGGNWNRVWEEFFKKNPTASAEEILEQLAKMREQFGI